jgi:hypothetical protein
MYRRFNFKILFLSDFENLYFTFVVSLENMLNTLIYKFMKT